jgi:hypothetical protein
MGGVGTEGVGGCVGVAWGVAVGTGAGVAVACGVGVGAGVAVGTGVGVGAAAASLPTVTVVFPSDRPSRSNVSSTRSPTRTSGPQGPRAVNCVRNREPSSRRWSDITLFCHLGSFALRRTSAAPGGVGAESCTTTYSVFPLR